MKEKIFTSGTTDYGGRHFYMTYVRDNGEIVNEDWTVYIKDMFPDMEIKQNRKIMGDDKQIHTY